MKLTIKHYFDFKDASTAVGQELDNPDSWDQLRVQQAKGTDIFFIPDDKSVWGQKGGGNQALSQQADDILNLLGSDFKRINSFGVGGGFLEYQIKQKRPSIYLQCSDYTPKAIERLRNIFQEADEIIQFDILQDPWINSGQDSLYLFYRIDTAFDNSQWRAIFQKLQQAKIEDILFVPCEFLTFKRFLTQTIKYWLYRLVRKPITFAGYIRTEEQIKDLFFGIYKIHSRQKIGNLQSFYLKLEKKESL